MIKDYDIYVLNLKENICFYFAMILLFLVMGLLFFNRFVVALPALILLVPMRKFWIKYLADKRRKELLLQFRDMLYSLSASFATGKQMGDSLKDASANLERVYGKDSILNKEVNYMVKKIFDAGESDDVVIREFARRTNTKEIMDFSEIYLTSKRTGADPQRVIRKTVEILLDRMEIEKEMHTLTAQKRLEFAILTIMPPLILLFLRLTSPEYLNPMYENLAGLILMGLALISLLIAAWLAYKITRIG